MKVINNNDEDAKKELNELQIEEKTTYCIPEEEDHFWFSYVTSPHYTMEIIIYITLNGILLTPFLQDSQNSMLPSTKLLPKGHPDILFIVSWLILILPFTLISWVIFNLSISAKRTYCYYKKINEEAIRYRKSILPYLW